VLYYTCARVYERPCALCVLIRADYACTRIDMLHQAEIVPFTRSSEPTTVKLPTYSGGELADIADLLVRGDDDPQFIDDLAESETDISDAVESMDDDCDHSP